MNVPYWIWYFAAAFLAVCALALLLASAWGVWLLITAGKSYGARRERYAEKSRDFDRLRDEVRGRIEADRRKMTL